MTRFHSDTFPRTAWCLLAVAMLVFLPGIAGPFVLDDHVNLAPVWNWLQGQQDFAATVFGNRSGPGGRPLAYLSFMANASLGADATLGFKLVNLALHAANTALVYLVAARILSLHGPAPRHAALTVAALWALHPMQVSTVLYVVQRMALLGALVQLVAVWLYLEARSAGDPARARRLLFVAIPAVVGAGFFAKETALLAPLLCAAIEFTLFPRATRTREVHLFFAMFLLLPALLAIVWLATHPERILRGYLGREYSLGERLLTEPRVVLEYAWRWFFPAKLALYRDGYAPLSTWPTALPALLAAGAALAAAFALRARAPLAALAIAWFFAGHALEAGPFSLELYFEHRNYLPSLGLALLPLALWPARARVHAPAIMGAAALLFAAMTLLRSHAWSDTASLLAAEAPPAGETSRRLQVDLAIHAMTEQDTVARSAALDVLAQGNAGDRAAAAAWRVIFACELDGGVTSVQLGALRTATPAVITHNHVSWLGLIVARAAENRCTGLSRSDVLAVLDAWQAAAHQPLSSHARQRLPALRARLQPPPRDPE